MNQFLYKVQRPSRYINHEINAVHKSWDDTKVKIALVFPDTYEVGMSHIGLKILYGILNSRGDVLCERAYAPWIDYEKILRNNGIPLMSAESSTPLNRFDIIGFTLQYELTFTNILNILDLSEIPLRTEERERNFPLIIAGGPCASNPEPLSEFIDVFVIGDGEDVINEIIDLYREWKENGSSKTYLLNALTTINGVYVPMVSQQSVIRKRIVYKLDGAYFPDKPVIPYARTIHDRIAIEVSRGCTRGCRFCQAGIIYRPLRDRTPSRISEIADRSLKNTGYNELSLVSLSIGDYYALLPLLREITDRYSSRYISVSLPSIRIGTLNNEIIQEIKKVRKTGFTIAPEAGSERLRAIINKPLDEEGLSRTVADIFTHGWNLLKMYFMIGLPFENHEDLDGIVAMCHRILESAKRHSKRFININVSVSTFVPKPHTPFQWSGLIPQHEIIERMGYLKSKIKRRLNLKFHIPEMSLLEACISRGDKNTSRLIEEAWRLGCRFDGWTELFDFKKWLKASEVSGIDLYNYAYRNIPLNEELPWKHIDVGVTTAFLKSEYTNAERGNTTEDCRYYPCTGCGLEKDCGIRDLKVGIRGEEWERKNNLSGSILQIPQSTVKIRIQYSKTGLMRFLSHLELATIFTRALSRAGIPLVYSRGFNPHPKISFVPPLPVGVEGVNEYFDIEVIPPIDVDMLIQKIDITLPEGISVSGAKAISKDSETLSSFVKGYIYSVKCNGYDEVRLKKRIESLMQKDSIIIERKTEKGVKIVNIREMLQRIEIEMDVNKPVFKLWVTEASVPGHKLQEILRVIFDDYYPTISMDIKRIGLYGIRNGEWLDPLKIKSAN